ncbi:MAG: nucleotide exchange factor GrpE, partial [Coleofasciculus sp. S288]|nr:nucleotide exchange factor GrpE [Coleofasciculus sp. S288]
ETLTQQCDSFKNQSVRIAADFDNFRKRTSKEKEDLEQQIKGSTITELLPVVDNFERARSQIKPQTDGEMAIHKSYQGVYKQLVDGLKRLGVSPMRPEGQEFDPNLHEAVMREATNEYPEGAVIEQLMRGYFLGERVLRHAMVKVAAAPEPVVTSEEGTSEPTEG